MMLNLQTCHTLLLLMEELNKQGWVRIAQKVELHPSHDVAEIDQSGGTMTGFDIKR